MRGTAQGTERRSCARIALLGALTVFGACFGAITPSVAMQGAATPRAAFPTAIDGYSGANAPRDAFTGPAAHVPQIIAQQPDINCPAIEVRRGASTLTISPPGPQSAMTLKYQGSFIRQARECTVADGTMVIKVGVEGRVVIGPAGGPGPVNVPLRFAVVQETPSGIRAITTKFVIVPVNVTADGNTLFSYVEEGLTFPVPTPATVLDDYVVYVGFDPVSAEAQSKAPAPKVRPKPKKKPAARAN